MKNKGMSLFFAETWVLTISSLITKILSAFYRIPLQNLVGNRGFFIYQQVYPLYGLCTAIALSGLPMFVSQVLAEDKVNQAQNQRHLLQGALVLGIVGALLLKLAAPQIASGMGDPSLTPLVAVLSWFYLLAPLEAVLRGIYQSDLQMLPTAISQVSEQIIRVLIIIIAAICLSSHDYLMGTWAHAGAAIGAAGAIIILLGFHLPISAKPQLQLRKAGNSHLLRRFLSEGLLLSLFSGVLVLFQAIDSFTVFKALQAAFYQHAQELKGIYDRAQPLAQLAIVLAVSLATTILPQLSQSDQDKQAELKNITLHVALVLAASCAVGMAALMPQINTLFFKDAQQSWSLAVYVLAAFFIAYAIVINTLMQAQHQQQQNWLALLLAVISKWLLNRLLIPPLGILGASSATLLASIILAVLLYFNSDQSLRQGLFKKHFLLKLSLVMLLLFIFVKIMSVFWRFFEPLSRLSALWEVSVTIICSVILVVILSYRWQLLTGQEWKMLPGGQRILQKLGEKHALR